LAAEGIASLNGGDLAVVDYTDVLAPSGTDSPSSIAVVPAAGISAAGLIDGMQSALSVAVRVGRPGYPRRLLPVKLQEPVVKIRIGVGVRPHVVVVIFQDGKADIDPGCLKLLHRRLHHG
jgi:hypothetical protein